MAILFALIFAAIATVAQESAPTDPEEIPAATYDKTIFRSPIPSAQLEFLNRYDGQKAGNVLHDRQYKSLIKAAVPDVLFHYGWETMLSRTRESSQ